MIIAQKCSYDLSYGMTNRYKSRIVLVEDEWQLQTRASLCSFGGTDGWADAQMDRWRRWEWLGEEKGR